MPNYQIEKIKKVPLREIWKELRNTKKHWKCLKKVNP